MTLSLVSGFGVQSAPRSMPTLVCEASWVFVAAHALRRDGEVADLRSAVAGRHAAAELPCVARPIEQAPFRRIIEKVALDRKSGGYRGAAGKAENRVDGGDRGGLHAGRDITDPMGCQTDLFAKTATPV